MCCCAVAERLVAKSEVYCYGRRLPITGCTQVTISAAVDELPVSRPGFQGSQTESSVTGAAKDNIDVSDDDYRIDLNTGWWDNVDTAACPSHERVVDFERYVTDRSNQSDTVELQRSPIDSPPLRQCLACQDDNTDEECIQIDSDSDYAEDDKCDLTICKRAVVEQDNNETLIRPQKSQRRTELVREQLQQNAKAKTTTRKINVFEEKLCLLERMIAAGNVNFPCRIRVNMAENAVELVADEENITESEIRLYELIANFHRVSLHLPGGVVNLLLSSRGKGWLQMQLASLDVVFYAKDSSCPFVLGASSSVSMDAKFLLEAALSNKKIPFIDEHVTFLRSAQWAFAVEKFQSEFFVVVNTEYSENVVVLEGSIDALNNVSKSIELMLKQNGRIQCKIDMSAAQFQLLLHFRVEIHDKLRSETTQHQHNRYQLSLLTHGYNLYCSVVCLSYLSYIF